MNQAQTAPPSPASNAGAADAQIYEQGYRSYQGPRTGVSGAIKSLWVHSVRAVLGLGRPARHKIMPVAVILFSFTPAVVFVGLAALLPSEIEESVLPTYAEYYPFITAALFLFAAFVAPELLCTDRRTGMLGVYLASPLSRATYLLGKLLSIMSILAIVTIGPPLLLLIALSLVDAGPSGWGDGFSLGFKIVLAGLAMSAYFAAISMAVSAATDRRAAATAVILGLLVGTPIVFNLLVGAGDLPDFLLLGDLLSVPVELAFRIHGEIGDWSEREVPTWQVWAALVGFIGASAAWTWDRYRRMLVRR